MSAVNNYRNREKYNRNTENSDYNHNNTNNNNKNALYKTKTEVLPINAKKSPNKPYYVKIDPENFEKKYNKEKYNLPNTRKDNNYNNGNNKISNSSTNSSSIKTPFYLRDTKDRKSPIKYNENNFIYYINVFEIINNINKRNIPFSEYGYKLFKFSYKFNSCCENKCEYCGNLKNKKIKYIGTNYPKFLLLNCTWEKKQNINDVLKFLYLLSLEDHLNNLFYIENKKSDESLYNLLGMILYSSALSHYISVIFNMEKNIFILYDDDKIKELSSIHEVYKEITSEQIKKNPNVFFYPVLLIYYREILYNDNKTMELNDFSEYKFHILENDCLNAINSHKALTKEQKRQNYLEYVKAQNAYDKKRKFSMEPMNSSFDMIIEEEQKNSINKFSDDINYKNNYSNMNMDKKDDYNNMFVEENNKNQDKYEIRRNNKRSETQYRNNYQYKSFGFFNNII